MTQTSALKKIITWLQSVAPQGSLHSDSRELGQMESGDAVFFAYPGDTVDGRNFIADAIQRGTKAVVYEAADFTWNADWMVPHLPVHELKKQVGFIAAAYYRQPGAGMFTVAVTGTNGKTSCSQWIASALSRQGYRTAAIGTTGVSVFQAGENGHVVATGYTTPDAVFLQRNLASLREKEIDALMIEASSIGLEQGRMNGMHLDVALFTNFTRDHLDYHHDMAAYAAVKKALFDWPGLRHAVFNLDDPMGRDLAQTYHGKLSVVGYSLDEVSLDGVPTIRASGIRTRLSGTEFHVDSPFGSARLKVRLVGQFNVSNVLGVLGVLLAKGVEWDSAISAIQKLAPVAGRMQKLGGRDAPMVVIDYAHTPDALRQALAALQPVAKLRQGQLWCVFGCGGDRDQGKRPQMGKASEAADHVVVTSDNPRNEDPQQIIDQIVSGMQGSAETVIDRAAAILSVVKQAKKGDVILFAGKGSENFQESKGKKFPFADAEHASLALASRATMGKGGE